MENITPVQNTIIFTYPTNTSIQQTRPISSALIPEDSLLSIMARRNKSKSNGDTLYIETDDPSVNTVIDYLIDDHYPLPPSSLLRETLDYYGVYPYDHYDNIYAREKQMRDHLYDPEYVDHLMNQDSHFRLVPVELDELADKAAAFWDELNVPASVLFRRESQFRYQCCDRLHELNFLFQCAAEHNVKLLVAGGYVFNSAVGHLSKNIFRVKDNSSDIDIFFVDSEEEDIMSFIRDVAIIIPTVWTKQYFYWKFVPQNYSVDAIVRRKQYISIISGSLEFQFILRRYRTYSEVLHGFDVDSCCIGYDGEQVYATERCMYALFHGYNTVNLDLLSPSYEVRLAKYGVRGIGIYVPNFKISEVSVPNGIIDWHTRLSLYNGLDVLLYLSLVGRASLLITNELEKSDYHEKNPSNTIKLKELLIKKASFHPDSEILSNWGFSKEELLEKVAECSIPDEICARYKSQYVPIEICAEIKDHANTPQLLDYLLDVPPFEAYLMEAFLGTPEFITKNPGQQATGTLHKTELEDPKDWYTGYFYKPS
eukprot:TRINITY_DN431_c0_g3_i2.p1 TRINITY_DN431_c0_g3~~TRINITY_DN431_c0_g3_i2.p1  ORF type:complete len:539 (+),score=82.00 TRINITY_DN431_c0_g3_i2:137-1753(+)